ITVNNVVVDSLARTVTLTLSRAVDSIETLTVSYTRPTTGNDVLQDAAGNDADNLTNQAAVNNTAADDTAPVINSAAVHGHSLVLSYTEASSLGLDAANTASAAAFTVLVNGVRNTVTAVSVDATAKTVTLTLTDAVTGGESVTVAYTKPTTGKAVIRDVAGNAAASFPAMEVANARDTTPPALVRTGTSAPRVNGNQLVLTFTEANALDARHIPAPGAFAVLVSGVLNTVTAVAVDATAKTVTLTLSTAVAYGQSVSVSYTDPTPSDNANAIQDNAGNDAATFTEQKVTNDTAASSGGGGGGGSGGGSTDRAPDGDADGVSNDVEDRVPGLARPDGSPSVAGDGNGDGIKDSAQTSVSSISVTTAGTSAKTYATLTAGGQNGKPGADHDTHITKLEEKAAPADMPRALEAPIGLTNFQAKLAANTHTEDFSLYVDAAQGINGYWMKGAAGTWVNLASEPYGGKMVLEGGRLRLDFRLEDGGTYDTDGQANGNITGSGAAAHMPLSIVGQMSDPGSNDFWL
ncbi:SwmB domain-containing protein, partial [Verminephrobacter aporrectodeae]|uniref:SwmB domain-containing protein n=1 Tax=Verminephrobacter aporrectodeae TaxID=1110389 RepID=UPI0002377012